MVTNSIKALKMVHIKKYLKKKSFGSIFIVTKNILIIRPHVSFGPILTCVYIYIHTHIHITDRDSLTLHMYESVYKECEKQ